MDPSIVARGEIKSTRVTARCDASAPRCFSPARASSFDDAKKEEEKAPTRGERHGFAGWLLPLIESTDLVVFSRAG